MINVEEYKDEPPEVILAAIHELSDKIVTQQRKSDKRLLKTRGGALGLQDLRAQRSALQALLGRPRVVTVDGKPV